MLQRVRLGGPSQQRERSGSACEKLRRVRGVVERCKCSESVPAAEEVRTVVVYGHELVLCVGLSVTLYIVWVKPANGPAMNLSFRADLTLLAVPSTT